MKKTVMQDQEIMQDLLISENRMTTTYNQFTNECASQQIHDQFQNLLNEEHEMHSDLLEEMKNRGWYPTPAATPQKMEQVRQNYQQGNPLSF